MSDLLHKHLVSFISTYMDKSRPILVAVSGGPDSLALFLLLTQIESLQLSVAHVDHSWRESSTREALELEKIVLDRGCSFYVKKLDPTVMKGNLENAAREERYGFFKELIDRHGFQGVMLGHHAGDVAETVLKRIFEGADITKFSGMDPVKKSGGITLFRPFLSLPKSVLLAYIKESGLQAVEDCTNGDTRFLRGKMREMIIPELSDLFGKNISPALCSIASRARELNEYLNIKLGSYLDAAVEGKTGLFMDFNPLLHLHPFELSYLIKKLLEREGLTGSKMQRHILYDLLLKKTANKRIIVDNRNIEIDRGRLFFMRHEFPFCEGICSLDEGNCMSGSWIVKTSLGPVRKIFSSPLDILKGEFSVALPKGMYFLEPAQKNLPYRNTTLDKWWSNNKVPAFLRQIVPVISDEHGVKHEFLSGNPRFTEGEFVIRLFL